jgi:RimJ/RimL family protein N-acetyltransferase
MKIETKRLILREVNKKDAKDIQKNINNLEVSKWLLVVPYPYKLKDAEWWVNHCQEDYKKKVKDKYNLVIELKKEKRIIGAIGLKKIDNSQGSAEVGYWIGEDYWKYGYGSETLNEILKFAFNKLKLRRIDALVFTGNPSSGKLLEKFGAKLEGIKRKSCKCKADGKIKDELCYGLLKTEWRKLK